MSEVFVFIFKNHFFSGHRLLCWIFFFQYLKDVGPLSSSLHCFWWSVCCNSPLCFSECSTSPQFLPCPSGFWGFLFIFSFQQFRPDVIWYLLHLGYFIPTESVVWCLSLCLKNPCPFSDSFTFPFPWWVSLWYSLWYCVFYSCDFHLTLSYLFCLSALPFSLFIHVVHLFR